MSYLESLFGLSGKTALCTGATRGIGQAMALALAKAGADIILVQRNLSNLETQKTIQALGTVKTDVVECDLSDISAVKGLAKKVTVDLGRTVDIVINCGGIQRRNPSENFLDQDWDDVIRVNLEAVWVISRDFGKHMLASRGGVSGETWPLNEGEKMDESWKSENGGKGFGKIINIASLCSFQGGITIPAYSAAKHGAAGLTKTLANEWSIRGVNVNAIAPGYIATDMNEAILSNPTRSRQIFERMPVGRWGSPSDFEAAALYLAGRGSDYVCGECLVIDGGWMGR